jgi:serine/threonine protein kinase/tetratricopeptide (TPR) repeat protein
MVPKNISHYRIIRLLGQGGMGQVYLAEDTLLRRRVALKRLTANAGNNAEVRQRLIKEARAAAVLSHPNIAVIHDVIEDGEDSFIVMEYLDGQSLKDELLHRPFPLHEVVAIGIQLCDALEEAHRHGVIHRDLKPGNIVMTARGQVKILDFGLAKAQPPGDRVTTTGEFLGGTPAYMPPEQKLGYRADHRSDIFSLGVVLYELVTGDRPCVHDLERAMPLDSSEHNELLANEIASAAVPVAFGDMVAKAMAWNPDARHQSARELRDALGRIEEGLREDPTVPRPARRKPLPGRALRSKLQRMLAAALVLAVVTGTVLWWANASSTTDGPPVIAVLPLANVSGDPSIDHIGVGIAHTLITKLSALPTVTTVSSTTAREYGAESDIPGLARDLGATFIVNGSVQRVADTLHVTVNLVRADDSIAWGGAFDGSMAELFGIQRRLASGLATGLELNLTPAEAEDLEAPPTNNVDAYAEFSQGRSLLERIQDPENIDRSIRLLESSVEKDPAFVQAHAALSEAYWAKFERTTDSAWIDKARASAEEARRLDPDHPAVRYALAKIYHETGDADRAIDELQRTLTLQPNYADAHALLGDILAERGGVDAAAAEIQKAIDLRPNFWGYHSALGLVYYHAGRPEDALGPFRRITELQPDLPNGFQSLGATYHSMGALDQAVSNYQEAIRRGHSWVAHSNLGTIYYRRGQFSQAVEQYEKALELNPNRHVYHRNLGDAYTRLNRSDDARRSYTQAKELASKLLTVNPNEASVRSFLGLCEAKLGNTAEARRLVAEAVELAPQDAGVQYDAAVVHALTGDVEQALSFLQTALRHGYSRSEASVDDDLASLHGLAEFENLWTGTQ